MRQGLVLVGAAFLCLGLVLFAVGIASFPYSVRESPGNTSTVLEMPPFTNVTLTIPNPVSGGTGGEVSFSYNASASVIAYLVHCLPNPGSLPNHLCVLWSNTTDAQHSITLTNCSDFPYALIVYNPTGNTVYLHLSFTATSNLEFGLALWEAWTVMAASASLIVLGGILSFLGLFLRGDPYTPKETVPPPASDPDPAEPVPPGLTSDEKGAESSDPPGTDGTAGDPSS